MPNMQATATPTPDHAPRPWRKALLAPLVLLLMGVAAALPGE